MIIGEAAHVKGKRVYEKSLNLPFNFATKNALKRKKPLKKNHAV